MEVAPPYSLPRNPTHPPTTPPAPSRFTSSRFTAYMSGSHNSSHHFGSYSQPSSLRSSDSTNATSASTLFNPPPLPTLAPVSQNDSVLNKRGDKEGSLFQICLNLRQRLTGLHGFPDMLMEEEEDAGEDADPVTIMWRFFRKGYPLMDLYNATGPRVPLEVDPTKVNEKKRGQAATFKFMAACMKDLGIADVFVLQDLYGDDTTGFVKVTRVVNQVLDILVNRGLLNPSVSTLESGSDGSGGVLAKKTRRQHIVAELVNTERTYVQHLELLHAFKKLVEEKGVIGGDAIHNIFFNLNALLDFQRRFLIRVEQTNILPEDDQDWGSLFVLYKDAFMVYEQYIANQNVCEATALREFDKLREVGGPPELRQFTENTTVLSAFLLKPFQRLSKYPLLLKELRDKGDLDPIRKQSIEEGIEAALSVLTATNAAVDRQERHQAMAELNDRVEDWKGHQLQSFGDLLLHGTYQVIKGDSANSKEQEREYKMYLFEMILLCCKEMNANKQKNKVLGGRAPVDGKGRPKLQLKGRIFMQNVTDTVMSAKPGSYSLQIYWKGDPGVESFTIRFTTEDVMRRWWDKINVQRSSWRESARMSQKPDVRDDVFHYTTQLGEMKNPYADQYDDEEDDYDGSTLNSNSMRTSHMEYNMGRNDSNTSLRSRSTTGDSMRMPQPPRQFPMGQHAPVLQVRTNTPASPGEMNESFFSPATESPISTRSSGTQSIYGYNMQQQYPRQPMPPIPGWAPMDDHRFTAPAMSRQQMTSYQSATRVPQQRPSLPPSAHSTNSSANRLRSASSPDIANPLRRYDPSQMPPMPDLPHMPQHVGYGPGLLNRSQSSSPAQSMTSLPVRAATQSPQAQLSRVPSQPTHPRTPSGHAHEYLPPPSRPFATSMDRYANAQPEVRMPTGVIPMHGTPVSLTPGMAPPPSLTPGIPTPSSTPGLPNGAPSQFKVRVHVEVAQSSMVLVVPVTISFQSLKDRIDQKLQRTSNLSLGSGGCKLKYKDEGDYVSVLSDEDVQMAFETWRESGRGMGEVELWVT